MKVSRFGIVLFWLAFALSVMAVIPDPFRLVIIWIGGCVFLIHLAEYLYARYMLHGLIDKEISLVKTVFFGFTHLVPLLLAKSGRRRSRRAG
jgi:hypothetical protein